MKEISHNLGRVAVLVSPEELTSYSPFFAPQRFEEIVKRYSFRASPNLTLPFEQIQKDGLQFRLGKTTSTDNSGAEIAIETFRIHNDGFVVDARTTEEGERFLADIVSWGKEQGWIRDPIRQPRRVYASQVVIEFEPSINQIIKKFETFSQLFGNLLNDTYKFNASVELQNLSFDYDRLTVPPLYDLVRFFIERRVGHKYEENRFFCQAPLRTSDHIKVLQSMEKLLSR